MSRATYTTTTLTVVLTAAMLVSAATLGIAVQTQAPMGGTSSAQTKTINTTASLPPPVYVMPIGNPTAQADWDTFDPDLSGSASGSMALSYVTPIVHRGSCFSAQGYGFSSSSKIRIYGQTTSGNGILADAVDNSGAGGNVYLNASGNRLAAIIPTSVPSKSMYLAFPADGASLGHPLIINRATAHWCQCSKTGNSYAIAGETITVFGKSLANLADPTKTWIWLIKDDGTGGQFISSTSVNPYKVQFMLPGGLTNGATYRIYIHNGHGGEYGWSDHVTLIITTEASYGSTFGRLNYAANQVNISDYFAGTMGPSHPGVDCIPAFNAAKVDLQRNHPNQPGQINMDVAGDCTIATPLNCETTCISSGGGGLFCGVLLNNTSGGTVRIIPHGSFAPGKALIHSSNGCGAMKGITWTTAGLARGNPGYSVSDIWWIENCTGDNSNHETWTIVIPSTAWANGTILRNNNITGQGFYTQQNRGLIEGNTFRLAQDSEAPIFFYDNKYWSIAGNTIRDKTDVGKYAGPIPGGTGKFGPYTMEAGLNWVRGTRVVLKSYTIDANAPSGATLNCVKRGIVDSYDAGTGVTTFTVTTSSVAGVFSNWVISGHHEDSGSGRIFFSQVGASMFNYIAGNTSIRLVSGNAVGKGEQIGWDGIWLSGAGLVAISPVPTATTFKITGITVK